MSVLRGLVKPGESTIRGSVRFRPAGLTSVKALVRVVLNTSYGRLVMPASLRSSSDSIGVMYRARCRPADVAGYHSETISSLAVASATQGSGREVSFRYRDVVPTGWRPVGAGR